jgi:hypothetical protein
MEFMVGGYLSKDGRKILLWGYSAGVCAARVNCEDIRQEFGVRLSNEDLRTLAIREANRTTLSEIAASLFKANRYAVIQGMKVVDISQNDLAARRKDFAWGSSNIPASIGIPEPTKVPFTKFDKGSDIVDRMLGLLGHRDFFLCNPNEGQRIECGADVSTKVDGCLIGFQVTQYQPDVDENTGKKGSKLRQEESRKARVSLLAAMSVKPLSMSALAHSIQEKAKKGWP